MGKPTVLIVDDEQDLVMMIKIKLESEGFRVIEAYDGEEALEKVKEKPDLILLDIMMPKMDGLTMLEKLREDSWGKKVPVIILTNLSSGAEMSRSAEGGVSGYLVKTDWKLDDVVKKIKETLK